MKSPLQPEEIRLLTEVGFLAGARGDLPSARVIFGALVGCRPTKSFGYIGLAMALLNLRDHDEAVRTLDRGLAMVVGAQTLDLHAVRALALSLAGRASECERAIKAAGNHPLALALAGQPASRA
jgi:hypothetical protein